MRKNGMNWHKKKRCVCIAFLHFILHLLFCYFQFHILFLILCLVIYRFALFLFSLILLFSYNKSYYLPKFVLLVFMSHNLNIISFLIQSEIVNLVSIRYDTVKYYSVFISGPTVNSPEPALV